MKYLWQVLLIMIAPMFGHAATPTKITFRKTTLTISGHKLDVEVAENEEQRSRGLMFRTSLKANSGMLFVFEQEDPAMTFWMKNTFIPLGIGFFDKDKKLIDIQEMQPVHSEMETPLLYKSKGPAQYALEVNPAWFKKNKVGLGAQFLLGSKAPSKRSPAPTKK